MDRFSVTPSDVTADSCCTAKTCDCSMRMRVCVFNRNESVCSDREMQESDSLGQYGRNMCLNQVLPLEELGSCLRHKYGLGVGGRGP